MTQHNFKQLPISLRSRHKTDVRTQFAALCYRIRKDKPEFLLVTSRRTGRWIIPKGWPVDGKTPADSALMEAWEEAGVRGRVTGPSLGLFSYFKDGPGEDGLPCVAMVFPVRVRGLSGRYPERAERKRKWMRPKKAAASVGMPELAHILREFDPRLLRR
ncbi:NUDIX domain-containing protein [Roseovarius salis]|uniref:NUDIX hydrolase n=1 Tax=Roseovarius salis TaxID=3376063 RepID=UPI0037C73320